MKHNCYECGTQLNEGHYVCPACRHFNKNAQKADIEEQIADFVFDANALKLRLIEIDELNAKK